MYYAYYNALETIEIYFQVVELYLSTVSLLHICSKAYLSYKFRFGFGISVAGSGISKYFVQKYCFVQCG